MPDSSLTPDTSRTDGAKRHERARAVVRADVGRLADRQGRGYLRLRGDGHIASGSQRSARGRLSRRVRRNSTFRVRVPRQRARPGGPRWVVQRPCVLSQSMQAIGRGSPHEPQGKIELGSQARRRRSCARRRRRRRVRRKSRGEQRGLEDQRGRAAGDRGRRHDVVRRLSRRPGRRERRGGDRRLGRARPVRLRQADAARRRRHRLRSRRSSTRRASRTPPTGP